MMMDASPNILDIRKWLSGTNTSRITRTVKSPMAETRMVLDTSIT